MRLTACGYGRDSSQALRGAIERSRQDNPFRTATIVVPTLAVGFAAKKELAWGSLLDDSSPSGVFGLRLFTCEGLGEHIISICDPASHIPNYTTREITAALMQFGDRHFGVFRQIRSHPSTYDVLVQTLRELERLSPAGIAELQKSGGQQILDLLRLHEAVRNHFQHPDAGRGDFQESSRRCSSASMLERAVELLEGGQVQNSSATGGPGAASGENSHSQHIRLDEQLWASLWEYLGSLIIYLPQQLSSTEGALLKACQPDEIILGLTGIEAADEMPLASVAEIDSFLAESDSQEFTSLPPNAQQENPDQASPPVASSQAPKPQHPFEIMPPSGSSYQPRAAQTTILSAPTPADEVRIAIRGVAEAIKDGFPADQLAIVYTAPMPYRRLLCEYLQSSEISFTHFSNLPLRERVAPKTLLAMLDLLDNDFKRIDLMNLLASAPIVEGSSNKLVPNAAWDRVSSEARVHKGLSQWKERLDRFIELHNAEIRLLEESDEEDNETTIQRVERSIAQARFLAEFVASFASSIKTIRAAETWRGRVDATLKHLRKFMPLRKTSAAFGTPSSQAHIWAGDEAEAYRQLKEILESLASLDDVHPNPSYQDFRLLLDKELEAASGRLGQQNVGVVLSGIGNFLAGSYSHIWIVGMVEGCLPMKLREDSLLPENVRKATPDLETQAGRIHEQHRHFLAALRLAWQQISFSYPRLNPMGSSTSLPSRWLLEVVEAMAGERVFAEDLDEFLQRRLESRNGVSSGGARSAAALCCEFVQSFTADLRTLNLPAREQEFNLTTLLPSRSQHSALANHSLVGRKSHFARGLEAYFSRRSSEFTRFDGNLSEAFGKVAMERGTKARGCANSQGGTTGLGSANLPPNAEDPSGINHADATSHPFNPNDPAGIFENPMSPTRLEKWAECPQAFFMESVLRLSRIEPLDDFEGLTPLVRGNIIHKSLEQFFREKLDALDPSHTWTAKESQRLSEIAEEHCREAISNFMFGPEVFHEQETANIQAELTEFLHHETEFRQSKKSHPVGLEVGFGREDPFVYPLKNGASLLIHGRIDRVDVASATGRVIVIDYKTGKTNSGTKPHRFVDLSEINPDALGRKLQMPLYLRAAEALFEELSSQTPKIRHENGLPNSAVYWFVNEASGYHQQTIDFIDVVKGHVDATLTTLHQEIAKGIFPPGFHSSATNLQSCPWCNLDNFGSRRYSSFMESKTLDSQLAPWLELAYPKKSAEAKN